MQHLPLSLLLVTSACTGLIDDPSATDGPGSGVSPTGDDGALDSSGPLPGADDAICGAGPSVGLTPLNRLTNAQYANAIRDLLAPLDVGNPAADLVAESALGGFKNNSAIPVSELEYRGYADQAARVAGLAATSAGAVFGCAPTSSAEEESCVRAFIDRFVTRAYRRPVAPDEAERLVALFETMRTEGDSFEGAASMIVEVVLQSPHFLYRMELPTGTAGDVVALDGYQVATRLSFFLWDTIPDEELLAAAASGELETPEQIEAHARRMLDAPEAQRAIESFHLQWLGVDDVTLVEKDAATFPLFDRALARQMRDETATFVDNVVRTGDGSLETLLLGGFSYLEGDLYEIYGVEPPASGESWARVELDPDVRPGVLTHPSFLAAHSHPDQTSPVHRGKTVRENFFCATLPAPPPDVDDTPPDPDPSLTTRERFAEHSENPTCAGCHQLMDPIGLAFEAFDALGQHRTTEAGRPIDTTGRIVGTDVEGDIDGLRDLSERIYESREARECLVRNWYRFALGRLETGQDLCSLGAAYESFEGAGRNVRELMIAIVKSDAFRLYRIPEVAE